MFRASASQLVGEPGFCRAPVAEHRGFGDVEQLCRFGDIETTEEPALDEGGLARLDSRQIVQRVIERDQVVGVVRRCAERFIERDEGRAATALFRPTPAGRLDEDLP